MSAESEVPVEYEDIIDQLKDKGKTPEIYEQFVPPVLTPKYAKTPVPKQQPELVKRSLAPEPEKQAAKTDPNGQSEPMAVLKPEIQSAPAPAKISAEVVEPQTTAKEEAVPATEQTISKVVETEPAGQEFAIQVASLKDPEKADILMNKFKEKGYPAFCQKSEVNGTTWHRVRIGPYPERALADKDQSRLKAAGVDSLIISME
jgi:cell division protein FtsN